MSVALKLRLPESEGDPFAGDDRPWLSYSVDDRRLHRHVRLRSGAVATSSIDKRADDGDLAADFDLSWLRSAVSPPQHVPVSSLRAADLFAGCGAMSLGLAEACRALHLRYESVFAAELDPAKAAVYETNFSPTELQIGEIERIIDGQLGAVATQTERDLVHRLGDIDVLLGGPPCQGHSDLNNHTRRDDERNDLLTRMARFAELFRPRHLVVENVQGVRHDRQRVASTTVTYLQGLGYEVEELLIACSALGVPQSRRRYMLVASLGRRPDLAAALRTVSVPERSVAWALDDLLDLSGGVFDTAAIHSEENTRRIRYLFEHGLHDLPDAQRPACHRQKAHSYKAVYGRMRWTEPAPTVTTGFGSTGQGRFVHPLRPRTLTPHEAARLQSIPDFFDFGDPGRTQLQKMIGNSVPPLAMSAVAMNLLR